VSQAPAPFDGTYELLVPTGMFNVLEPTDRDQAAAAFADLFSQMFPSIVPAELEMLVDGILRWRDLLTDRGIIFHGVVGLPAGYEFEGHVFGAAHWHIFAGVVEVPAYRELDAGSMMARIFGHEFTRPGTHTESFETVMGWGAGLITEIDTVPGTLTRPDVLPLPGQMAVAAVLSGEHGSNRALLVVGLAADVEQKHEMAAVVGLMGGKSTISVASDMPVAADQLP
jgi:hypothetical protein